MSKILKIKKYSLETQAMLIHFQVWLKNLKDTKILKLSIIKLHNKFEAQFIWKMT